MSFWASPPFALLANLCPNIYGAAVFLSQLSRWIISVRLIDGLSPSPPNWLIAVFRSPAHCDRVPRCGRSRGTRGGGGTSGRPTSHTTTKRTFHCGDRTTRIFHGVTRTMRILHFCRQDDENLALGRQDQENLSLWRQANKNLLLSTQD